MASPRSRLLGCASVALLVVAAVAAHPFLFPELGRLLVNAEQPEKADIAVVLAGDGYGHRITRAAELVRQDFVPRVLVSGPPGNYGFNEAELAIPFIVKQGNPEKWFIPFPVGADSTREEAQAIVPELKKRGVRKFLVVTSDYHTRRARRIFGRYASDLDFRVVAARDEFFRADDWWRTRQGQKVFALEVMKTLADWMGL